MRNWVRDVEMEGGSDGRDRRKDKSNTRKDKRVGEITFKFVCRSGR